jgi:hypothetical protein
MTPQKLIVALDVAGNYFKKIIRGAGHRVTLDHFRELAHPFLEGMQ